MSETEANGRDERLAAIMAELEAHGPATADDIDGVHSVRTDGTTREHIRRVRFTFSHSTVLSHVQQTSVYYLDTHRPEAVVRKYIYANPNLLELPQGTLTLKFGHHSDALREAWRRVVDEYPVRTEGTGKYSELAKGCPLCGNRDIVRLPDHLPKCSERDSIGGADE